MRNAMELEGKMTLRGEADRIIAGAIQAVMPQEAVVRALQDFSRPSGRLLLVSVGKAGWTMAKTAAEVLGGFESGIVITKYGHVRGEIDNVQCFEAGHPVPDENSFRATKAVMDMVSGLTAQDTVLFLLSGGGSALFEWPLIPAEELSDITSQLLASGADITEMNTVRKRLSAVKGGRFAELAAPAHVYGIILSDILGDPVDMIASGPACPDPTSCQDALAVAGKYRLSLSEEAGRLLRSETPKQLINVTNVVTGSVRELCRAAAAECEKLGYRPVILTDCLCCEAKEAGSFLGSMLASHADAHEKLAFIAGGETVVHLTGDGLGGRNQELALSAAPRIKDLTRAAVFSVGSDGTDGPTDAAGGFVDQTSWQKLQDKKIDLFNVLQRNDAYRALKQIGGLIITGPTGTNVNDVAVGLLAE